MTDTPQRATRRKQLRLSPIWIVPLVAVLIGAWMLYDNFARRGPLITLKMESAEGIEAGKTQIKTRNVQVGRVEGVRLSEDLNHAIVTARMSEGVDRMLNAETRFWVVKPRIDREGISGLNTVLSGAYIQLLPGNSEEPQFEFQILDHPPVAPPDAEGLRLILVSSLSNSLSEGDAITYEGIVVGRVESTDFDVENRQIKHRVFIQAPYDVLVTDTTRFWTASGVNVRLDSTGLSVDIESVETLLGGGLTFGVPPDVPMGEPAKAGATFELYADKEVAREGTFDRFIEYVLLVDDTIRGLNRGAPVEYRGVRIGTVVSAPWRLNVPTAVANNRRAVPVLIRLEPRRLENERGTLTVEQWRSRLAQQIDRGLRASLKTGNLLTGALFVDLNFDPDADTYKHRRYENTPVFPTTSTGVAQIEQKLSNLLDKLNELELESVLASLDRTLKRSQKSFDEIQSAAASARSLLQDPATQGLPAELDATIAELQNTLQGFSADSPGYQQLIRTLERVESLMRELQPVVRTLREQPNALIFDKRQTPDPMPKAGSR